METEDEGPINQDRDWAAIEEGISGETTKEEGLERYSRDPGFTKIRCGNQENNKYLDGILQSFC